MRKEEYVLYQLGVSHYCEKVRWALAYKQLPHRSVSLLPGQHMGVVRKLTGSKRTEVPVLKAGAEVIRNSSDIITWLDQHHPEHSLTPVDNNATAAMEWEKYADDTIGDHVRRICYHTLLSHRDVLVPVFSSNGPWYGKFLLKAIFPKLAGLMRKGMKIDEAHTTASIEALKSTLNKLETARGESDYLVGEQFTRADLAAAALFAPLCLPPGYGHPMPATYPEPLASLQREFAPQLQWVLRLYKKHR